VCQLQAELTRLRCSVERGEAQRVELQYQLALNRRDAERVVELSRDKQALTGESNAPFCFMLHAIPRRSRLPTMGQLEKSWLCSLVQHMIISSPQTSFLGFGLCLLVCKDQEVALEESERRLAEVQKEREKEADVKRRSADELKQLMEREERSRRQKELLEQRVKSLQSNIEAERGAHLETKFNSEIIQVTNTQSQ
uniref:Uncharacterized protein n=1 Tax=Oreochromis niloticus TaxID=8128 RepID=A0A669B9V3_ORENI